MRARLSLSVLSLSTVVFEQNSRQHVVAFRHIGLPPNIRAFYCSTGWLACAASIERRRRRRRGWWNGMRTRFGQIKRWPLISPRKRASQTRRNRRHCVDQTRRLFFSFFYGGSDLFFFLEFIFLGMSYHWTLSTTFLLSVEGWKMGMDKNDGRVVRSKRRNTPDRQVENRWLVILDWRSWYFWNSGIKRVEKWIWRFHFISRVGKKMCEGIISKMSLLVYTLPLAFRLD